MNNIWLRYQSLCRTYRLPWHFDRDRAGKGSRHSVKRLLIIALFLYSVSNTYFSVAAFVAIFKKQMYSYQDAIKLPSIFTRIVSIFTLEVRAYTGMVYGSL